MARWKVLLAYALASAGVGCSSSMQAGLANAPRLGGTGAPAEGQADVVANRRDTTQTERASARDLVPTWITAGRPSLVMPWVQHFYVGWPCQHAWPGGLETAPIAVVSPPVLSTPIAGECEAH